LLYLLDGQDLAFQLTNNKSIFLSFISEIELLGFKKLTVKEEKQIRNLLNDNIIIDINAPIKQIAIDLRKKYALKIPDLIIAATSVYLDLPLISADAAFKNIEDINFIQYIH
ncbi:MAG TPA: PIN domain-containing protein, partial [Chitinophagales bacterium]|nr:PIN domain-containing protein [Chitinophagales bacterium]